jgi:Glycosyl hydrolase family 12
MNKNASLFSSSTTLIGAIGCLSAVACGSADVCAINDIACDGVPDDLGVAVDLNGDGKPDGWDGVADGYAVDRNGDGQPDALGLDTTGDGRVDSLDLNLDKSADEVTGSGTYGTDNPATGSGGTDGGSGGVGTGGDTGGGTGGTPPGTGGGTVTPGGNCLDDGGMHQIQGSVNGSDDSARYATSNVKRGSTGYRLITNGWGEGFGSQNISWTGTQMAVNSFTGSVGPNYSPAGYPTIYIGDYSNTGKSNNAPLPKAISAITTLNTGVRWSHPANSGEYNVSYDIWLSNNGSHSGFFMVWLRDPPGQRPAGDKREERVTVPGVPGVWDIWAGTVLGKPIINYVAPEGTAVNELSFNVKTFLDDAVAKGYTIPGSEVMSVAIGFEIWEGPVSDLKIEDFCVRVD